MNETIFALSSGAPPAAIAVIRISGPDARAALEALSASKPPERQSSVRRLRSADGAILDVALVLWLPGPATATGEDVAELHLHGGRAVVAAVESALEIIPGLRRATPGEFTRRAFANGRIDLAEAEGLADLLSAETELQRQQAISMASGEFSRVVASWRDLVLILSADVEARLDFDDDDDVDQLSADFTVKVSDLSLAIADHLKAPRAELLKDGFRVVLAGPPNSGKSSLFNRLVEAEAAITAPIAGTTRDVLTRPVALAGVPFVFADTAGLRDETVDVIEALGIQRARAELDGADLVLWLGPQGEGQGREVWDIESFADVGGTGRQGARHRVSARTGEGLAGLREDLIAHARATLPRPGAIALNLRQHNLLAEASSSLREAAEVGDLLLCAEFLRVARVSFDQLLGAASTEDMLDALFGRFCIGK